MLESSEEIDFQDWAHRFIKEQGLTKKQLEKGVKIQVPCEDGKMHEFIFFTVEFTGLPKLK